MRKLGLTLALLFASSSAGATPVITNGLVAAYEFRGDANDVSGNGNHGVASGATLTATALGTPTRRIRLMGLTTSQS
jgi:hypothetical protein